jgi:hypothetical protein
METQKATAEPGEDPGEDEMAEEPDKVGFLKAATPRGLWLGLVDREVKRLQIEILIGCFGRLITILEARDRNSRHAKAYFNLDCVRVLLDF